MRRLSCVASVAVLLLTWVAGAVAAEPLSVDLVLKAGRPFRVALDRKILIKRVDEDRPCVPSHAGNHPARIRRDRLGEAAGDRALALIKQPDKMSRLKDAVVARLPYHPQYLIQGLTYDGELTAPLSFGAVTPPPLAPVGTLPAPDSILTARLATTLDSSNTPRGTPLEAVLTEPVFSSDHQLILPEGTTSARRLSSRRRSGQQALALSSAVHLQRDTLPTRVRYGSITSM